MATSKLTVLESLQLAQQLLQEIKQHKTTNQHKIIRIIIEIRAERDSQYVF